LHKRELRLEKVEEEEEEKKERAFEPVISTKRDTKYEIICGSFANDIYKSAHNLRMEKLS